MPSFDIVSEVDKQEVKNAVEQTNKEVSTRFDFKGSDSRVEQAEYALTVFADDDFKLSQVRDVLEGKLVKRGVDIKCLDVAEAEKISGNPTDVRAHRLISTSHGVRTQGITGDCLEAAIAHRSSWLPCQQLGLPCSGDPRLRR